MPDNFLEPTWGEETTEDTTLQPTWGEETGETEDPTQKKPEYIDGDFNVFTGEFVPRHDNEGNVNNDWSQLFQIFKDPNRDGFNSYGIYVPDIDFGWAKFDADKGDDPDKVEKIESLKNTWNNSLDILSLTDDRLYHLSEQLFGDTNSTNFQAAERAIAKNEANQGENQQTLALEDTKAAFEEEGIVGGIAHAGVAATGAVASFVTSAVQAASTFGVGLAIDMAGSSVRDYTKARAEEDGITYEESAESLSGGELIVPLSIGALSYKLEKVGIKGVGKAINGMSNGAKKTLVQVLNASGKEGGTELGQGILEAFNQGLGKKGNIGDASEQVATFFEEDALETILQGMVGGGLSAGGGGAARRAANRLRSKKSEDNISQNVQKIMQIDRKLNDPNTPDDVKKILQGTRKSLLRETSKDIKEPNKILRHLDDNQIREINKKAAKIEKIKAKIQESRKAGEDVYNIVQDQLNQDIENEADGINRILEDQHTNVVREDDGTYLGNPEVDKLFEGKKRGEISEGEAAIVALEYENLAKSVAKRTFRAYPEFGEQGYTEREFAADLTFGIEGNTSNSLVGLAKSFEPGKGSFGGYANKYLKERAKAVLTKRVGKNVAQGGKSIDTGGVEGGRLDVGDEGRTERELDERLDATPGLEAKKITQRLGFAPETGDKINEIVGKVLKGTKLATATVAGFGKAITAKARESLYNTVKEELGKDTKANPKFFKNLRNNWQQYLKLIPPVALANSRGITQEWAIKPPTETEFLDYFRGIDIDASDRTQSQKNNAKAERRVSLANWIAQGIFNEAASDILANDPTAVKQFELAQKFKETDAVDSVNKVRIELGRKAPISESRINSIKGPGSIVKSDRSSTWNFTRTMQQAWNKNGFPVYATTNETSAANALVSNNIFDTKEEAEKYMKSVNGFTFLGNRGIRVIYNRDNGSAETPIHEMGHVWSAFVRDNNIDLWKEGIKVLLKDEDINIRESGRLIRAYEDRFGNDAVKVWDTDFDSDKIDKLVEDAIKNNDQNMLSALEEIFAGAIGVHGSNLAKAANQPAVAGDKVSFKNILNQVWNWIGDTLAKVKGKEIKDLTATEFLDLATSDVLSGKPGSAFAEMNIPIGYGRFAHEVMKQKALLKESKKDAEQQARYEAIDAVSKDSSFNGIDKAYAKVSEYMTKEEFLDFVQDTVNQNTLDNTQLQEGLMAENFEDDSTESIWKSIAGGPLTLLLGRPAKKWQNDEAAIQKKFDKNFEFFNKNEDVYTQHLPKEFWESMIANKKDGTQNKTAMLRSEDAQYFADKAAATGGVWTNPDAYNRIANADTPGKLNKLANDSNYQKQVDQNQQALYEFGDALQAIYETGEVSAAEIGSIIKSFVNSGRGETNIFRRAPRLNGYSDGLVKGEFVPEHNPPAGYIAMDMFNRIINGGWNQAFKDAIRDKFHYYALDKADDPGQGAGPGSLKSGITKGFNLIKDNPLVRYIVSGGNILSLKKLDGTSIAEELGVTQSFINAAKDSKELSKAINTAVVVKEGNVPYRKAGKISESRIPLDEAQELFNKAVSSDEIKKYSNKKSTKKWSLIPWGAEDFEGLLTPIYGKSNALKKVIEDFIYKPYNAGVNAATGAKIALLNNFKAKKLSKKFLRGKTGVRIGNVNNLNNGQLARLAAAIAAGDERLDLSPKQIRRIEDYVVANPKVQELVDVIPSIYTEANKMTGQPEGYIPFQVDSEGNINPEGNLESDVVTYANRDVRDAAMAPWLENANEFFSKENKARLQALYGENYIKALENVLTRMKSGRNRSIIQDPQLNKVLDWVNGSQAVIMFWNFRSAALQLISMGNFFKPSDLINGNYKIIGNEKSYLPLVWNILNSPYLKDRRQGVKLDVATEELLDEAFKTGSMKQALSKLSEIGFMPTKWADSVAIAFGGAMYYQARRNEGMSHEDAMKAFEIEAERAQQSSRPDRISSQQASAVGRLLLAFANTPIQYARQMKRGYEAASRSKILSPAWIDGSSKILYYGLIQSAMFASLQQALDLSNLWDDDDEDKDEQNRLTYGINTILDSLLRGTGLIGNTIAAMKASLGVNYAKLIEEGELDYKFDPMKLLGISPPISSKVQKLQSASEVSKGRWSATWPGFYTVANTTSAATNLPLDWFYKKAEVAKQIHDGELNEYQAILRALGWSNRQVGIDKSKKDPFDVDAIFEKAFKNFDDPDYIQKQFDSAFDRGETGQAFKDGTIEVDPNLSPIEREKTIAHEKEHVRQMNEDGLDYDDNSISYKGRKYMRKDGKIRYGGSWKPEGDKSFPWESAAYEVESPLKANGGGKKKKTIEEHDKEADEFTTNWYNDKNTRSRLKDQTGLSDEEIDHRIAAATNTDTSYNAFLEAGDAEYNSPGRGFDADGNYSVIPEGEPGHYPGNIQVAVDLNNPGSQGILPHEQTHALEFDNKLGLKAQEILGPASEDEYLNNPGETYGNLQEFRSILKLEPWERDLTPEKLQNLIEFQEVGKNEDVQQMLRNYDIKKLTKALNKIAQKDREVENKGIAQAYDKPKKKLSDLYI